MFLMIQKNRKTVVIIERALFCMSAISGASSVDTFLKLSQGHEDIVKAHGFFKIHITHRLVITSQCRQSLGWRHKAEGSGYRQSIVCP